MRRVPLFALFAVAAAAAGPVAASSPLTITPRPPVIPKGTSSQQRLARVGGQVEAAVRRKYPDFAKSGKRLRFGTVADRKLNAMALPDGRVYVTTAFMQALAQRPDDELAAILGHEATHVAQRHHAGQQNRAIAGAVLGALVGKAVAGAPSTGARVGGSLTAATYSRDDEYRADAGSVKLLAIAGYDPYAMGRVLGMLKDRYGRGDAKIAIVGWFASHPDTGKRIENANRVAGETQGKRQK